MTNPTRLSDILKQDREALAKAFDEADEAEDFEPLPPGTYIARIVKGELATARTTDTPSYKLTFRVLDGEHGGRQLWHDIWLTPAAIAMAKRDLGKLGVTSLGQLEQPLPQGLRCEVKLALRRDDDGNQYNRVRRFDVIGVDEPEQDPFAPDDEADTGEPKEGATGGES